ncbi:FtsB family cell division protein [Jeotgalibaca caeni]|uniref:FtsB family cell division protein n=1 Tax=Jeotgalibaca caeni TaxID=3028623 RepID=UPI00237EB88F|nr:hypothetical protein [Jeotgalibaca caeni]MDE1548208.1 hypothetical protein [Jeotgalibaca caeni]
MSVEKKSAREALENMKPDPENESPRRSWMYIFIAVLVIFGVTFVFQEMNDVPVETIDPHSFEQLKDQVRDLNQELDSLKQQNEALEQRIEDLES